MSQVFEKFVGVSYELQNGYASVERTVNWYLVANEEGDESKFKLAFEPSPGNQPFCALPVPQPFNQPNRGLLELRGVAFGVNGNVAFSIDKNGAYTNLGTVANDKNPVSMVANGNGQIFIASAGLGYVIPQNGGAASLIQVTTADFLGAAYATFQDGYILVITPGSNQFQISGSQDVPLGDATLWDAGNVSIQAGQADFLRAIRSSREYLLLLGARRSQVYQDVGAQGIGAFPFVSYNETFIETGLAAVFSLAELGDSLIWIGEDERGVRACWRMPAFQPQRMSTFAIETRWQAYVSISDAVAFPYIWNGHLMYRVTFPSAIRLTSGQLVAATWELDITLSALLNKPCWIERQYNSPLGLIGRPELFHCYAYGKHLVGSGGADGNPGAIYQMAGAPWTDRGVDANGAQVQQEVIRDRVAPHLWNKFQRRIYDSFELELARGVGLDGAPVVGVNPQVLLRWSNDGGKTFGPEFTLPAGLQGEYDLRVILRRLGSSRDRVFWVRCSDPVYWGIVTAMLDVRECSS